MVRFSKVINTVNACLYYCLLNPFKVVISAYLCTFSMQHEAILILNTTSVEAEFNVTVNSGEDMQRLCRIVSYYYLVEAIDNDSNIYYYMKQNALDALSYWVSFTSYFLLYSLSSYYWLVLSPSPRV